MSYRDTDRYKVTFILPHNTLLLPNQKITFDLSVYDFAPNPSPSSPATTTALLFRYETASFGGTLRGLWTAPLDGGLVSVEPKTWGAVKALYRN